MGIWTRDGEEQKISGDGTAAATTTTAAVTTKQLKAKTVRLRRDDSAGVPCMEERAEDVRGEKRSLPSINIADITGLRNKWSEARCGHVWQALCMQ